MGIRWMDLDRQLGHLLRLRLRFLLRAGKFGQVVVGGTLNRKAGPCDFAGFGRWTPWTSSLQISV